MNAIEFKTLAGRYANLRIAIVGDFCLDRYLEIDPLRNEVSLETGLPVYNVVNVRAQPGGAGTILNNLVALGVTQIYAVGMCGLDGEGFELQTALEQKPGVQMEHFVRTSERRTFTYAKPLMVESGKAPVELNRLDIKNWTPTPKAVEHQLRGVIKELAARVDAFIVLEQVDRAETGVVTAGLLEEIAALSELYPELLIVADSRRGLSHFPPLTFKMNGAELARLLGLPGELNLAEVRVKAAELARRNGQRVFVTLAEQGMVGAAAEGAVEHVPALPVRAEIDIVGAGDAVTANLTAALAAGASVRSALEMANAAASIVIHQLGTTGTASVRQISDLLLGAAACEPRSK